ncbi:MAG: hypothetical protein J1F60_11160, partial [Oscillospiraceae bacterium]|nr:hypothetical protein [Oscillospiraceae bacterium]
MKEKPSGFFLHFKSYKSRKAAKRIFRFIIFTANFSEGRICCKDVAAPKQKDPKGSFCFGADNQIRTDDLILTKDVL